jgi:tetratricopeptide (TPR) repeat protein
MSSFHGIIGEKNLGFCSVTAVSRCTPKAFSTGAWRRGSGISRRPPGRFSAVATLTVSEEVADEVRCPRLWRNSSCVYPAPRTFGTAFYYVETRRFEAARQLFEELVWQHPFDARIWVGFGQCEAEAALAEPTIYTDDEKNGLVGGDIMRRDGTAELELSAVDDLTWASSVFHRLHGVARARAVFRRGLIRAGGVWNESTVDENGTVPVHTFADYIGTEFVPDIEGWNEKDAEAGRWCSASKLYHAWALAEVRFLEQQELRRSMSFVSKKLVPLHKNEKRPETDSSRRPSNCAGARLVRRLFELSARAVNGRDPITWQAWVRFEASLGLGVTRARELFKLGVASVEQINPTCKELACLYQTWGVLEQREHRYDEAICCYERAVALNPNHARTLHAWGMLEQQRGRIDEARVLFERAIEVSNGSPHTAPAAYNLLGKLEWRQGRLDKARMLFQKGLEVAPGDRHLCHAMASLERHCGNYELAREYFARCTKLDELVVRDWAEMETRDVGFADIQLGEASRLGEAIEALSMLHLFTRTDEDISTCSCDEKSVKPGNESLGQQPQDPPAFQRPGSMQCGTLKSREAANEPYRRLLSWFYERLKHDQTLLNTLAKNNAVRADQLRLWITRRGEDDITAFRAWARSMAQSQPKLLRMLFRVPGPMNAFGFKIASNERKGPGRSHLRSGK